MKKTGLILAVVLAACGASARETTIKTTFAGLEAAEDGFLAFDAQHQLDIVKAAPDRATADAELTAYRSKRDKVLIGLIGGFQACNVAQMVNDHHSLSTMMNAALTVYKDIKDLGVKLPF